MFLNYFLVDGIGGIVLYIVNLVRVKTERFRDRMQRNHSILIIFIQMYMRWSGGFNNPGISKHLGSENGMVSIKFMSD
jgi:hypothetical protein